MTHNDTAKVHQGRNVKRFREMLGLKQEAFAQELGEEWTQRRVSLLEGKEEIEEEVLEQVAKVLKVSPEAIKNFTEEAAVTIISNTFQDESVAYSQNYKCNFNPLDKVVQLYDEKIELYERMLKDKNEMIEKLEQLLKEKK